MLSILLSDCLPPAEELAKEIEWAEVFKQAGLSLKIEAEGHTLLVEANRHLEACLVMGMHNEEVPSFLEKEIDVRDKRIKEAMMNYVQYCLYDISIDDNKFRQSIAHLKKGSFV